MDRIYKRFYSRLHTKLVGCVSFLVVDWIDGEFNIIHLNLRIRVKIADPEGTRYQVPESVFLHPTTLRSSSNIPSPPPFRSFARRLEKCCSTRPVSLSYSSRNTCAKEHLFLSMQISTALDSTLSFFDFRLRILSKHCGRGIRPMYRRGQIPTACT
jgi:hypothetical protein